MQYLAYGSNLLGARLLNRVPSASSPRVVSVPGHRVIYRKLSKDGSSKCDLVATPGDTAYGVMFKIEPADLAFLDAAEGCDHGYERGELVVEHAGDSLKAFVYRASTDAVVEGLPPYDWYRDLVAAGAREHGLPSGYIADQLDVQAVVDPNPIRAATQRRFLAGCD